MSGFIIFIEFFINFKALNINNDVLVQGNNNVWSLQVEVIIRVPS
jgi:hypothetical protein